MFNVILVGFSLVCVAGGISVGVLYCFGGGAARRVGFPGGGYSREFWIGVCREGS